MYLPTVVVLLNLACMNIVPIQVASAKCWAMLSVFEYSAIEQNCKGHSAMARLTHSHLAAARLGTDSEHL